MINFSKKIVFMFSLIAVWGCKREEGSLDELFKSDGKWNVEIRQTSTVTRTGLPYLDRTFTGYVIFYSNGYLEKNTDFAGKEILKWQGDNKKIVISDKDNVIAITFVNKDQSANSQTWIGTWSDTSLQEDFSETWIMKK
jgi:hypothetical protein